MHLSNATHPADGCGYRGEVFFDSLIHADARVWLRKVLIAAELVTITERIAACRDPTDDKFLELAVNGRADLIVSGDGDLLALNPFRQIPIVTPAAFVQGVARCAK